MFNVYIKQRVPVLANKFFTCSIYCLLYQCLAYSEIRFILKYLVRKQEIYTSLESTAAYIISIQPLNVAFQKRDIIKYRCRNQKHEAKSIIK